MADQALNNWLTGQTAGPAAPPAEPVVAVSPTTISPDQDQPPVFNQNVFPPETMVPLDYAPWQPQPEYLLGEWIADSRVYRPRNREYYSSLAVIVLLLSLILFFAGQTLLIFVLLAFLFVSFVLAATKPMPLLIRLTTYGLQYQGKLYYWNQLGRFWVRSNHGTPEIHIEAPTFIGRELVVLGSNEQSPGPVTVPEIVDVLRLYLINEEPPLTQIDKWIRWLEEKFPLESVERVMPHGKEPQPPAVSR